MGLLLGGVAALAARWTAVVLMISMRCAGAFMRGLAIVLAIDSSRRAVQLLF